jgi:hypothetical protein
MDSRQLTAEQAAKTREQLLPSLRYLQALRNRVQQRGFPPDDRLRQLVEQAHDAVHRLIVDLHYRSVGEGVWREPSDLSSRTT